MRFRYMDLRTRVRKFLRQLALIFNGENLFLELFLENLVIS